MNKLLLKGQYLERLINVYRYKSAVKKTRELAQASEIASVIDYEAFRTQMNSYLEKLRSELHASINLRTTAAHIEAIQVDVDNNVRAIGELTQVFEKKPGALFALMPPMKVANAIKQTLEKRGYTLQTDGNSIYVIIPSITGEYRTKLCQRAKSITDSIIVSLRKEYSKFHKELKDVDKEFSKDLLYRIDQTLLANVNDSINQAKKLMLQKQNEINQK